MRIIPCMQMQVDNYYILHMIKSTACMGIDVSMQGAICAMMFPSPPYMLVLKTDIDVCSSSFSNGSLDGLRKQFQVTF